MRNLTMAALVIGAGVLFSDPSGAMTLPTPAPQADPSVTLVDGGCGPAFFRAPNGVCYRKRFAGGYGYGYRPPPPPPYYRRFCPPVSTRRPMAAGRTTDAGRASAMTPESFASWMTGGFRTPVIHCCCIGLPCRPTRRRSSARSPPTPGRTPGETASSTTTTSTASPTRCSASLQARSVVAFGGPGGQSVAVRAGDVMVIPAGVAHRKVAGSHDLLVVGAVSRGRRL